MTRPDAECPLSELPPSQCACPKRATKPAPSSSQVRAEVGHTCEDEWAGIDDDPHWCTRPRGHRGLHQEDGGVCWRASAAPPSGGVSGVGDAEVAAFLAEVKGSAVPVDDAAIEQAALAAADTFYTHAHGPVGDMWRHVVRAVLNAAHRGKEGAPNG